MFTRIMAPVDLTNTDALARALQATADLARVMEPFTQLGSPTVRRHERSGSGIGLAICKRLAALMGARLAVESEVGEGTLVRVLFPAGSVLSVEDAVRLAGERGDAAGRLTAQTQPAE